MPPEQLDRINSNRIITWSNQLVNLLWSCLCLGPLLYYCYNNMTPSWLYGFLIISFIPFLLPNVFFDQIQLSASAGFYSKLGTRIVRKYTQDGDVINHWLQLKYPNYSPAQRGSLQEHVRRSYMNEKFHTGCFLFFLLSSLYAFHQGNWVWGVSILISNVIYNVYPILLQQYNRIRLTQLIKRRSLPARNQR